MKGCRTMWWYYFLISREMRCPPRSMVLKSRTFIPPSRINPLSQLWDGLEGLMTKSRLSPSSFSPNLKQEDITAPSSQERYARMGEIFVRKPNFSPFRISSAENLRSVFLCDTSPTPPLPRYLGNYIGPHRCFLMGVSMDGKTVR